MAVSQNDIDAMARIVAAMNGEAPIAAKPTSKLTESTVELAGPGQVTSADINAMADVLKRLGQVSDKVVDMMVTESSNSPAMAEAINTSRNEDGVKVGRYQILIKDDATRKVGKQYYSIYNTVTGDVIADDISLYETAISVVRLLNAGRYANSHEVRKLFEQDDLYTSHKLDAMMYKHRMRTATDPSKRDIFESRFQASLDRCMQAKTFIKSSVK